MRHEDIQRIYKDHCLISHKNMGGVRQLVGSVDVLVFFVNDTQSVWTERAKQRYRADQKAAMQLVLRTARSHGVRLQMRNAYIDTSIGVNCTLDNNHSWGKAIISKYGSVDIPAFQRSYEARHQCTEAPIIFALNKPFRSSAVTVDWETRMHGEMSIISSQFNQRTIIHELLHQFGAVDLYYPEIVRNLVRATGYDSIMAASTSMHIDSLTAYLIGWTDELDAAAVQLLERTKHLTKAHIEAALRKEYGKA